MVELSHNLSTLDLLPGCWGVVWVEPEMNGCVLLPRACPPKPLYMFLWYCSVPAPTMSAMAEPALTLHVLTVGSMARAAVCVC